MLWYNWSIVFLSRKRAILRTTPRFILVLLWISSMWTFQLRVLLIYIPEFKEFYESTFSMASPFIETLRCVDGLLDRVVVEYIMYLVLLALIVSCIITFNVFSQNSEYNLLVAKQNYASFTFLIHILYSVSVSVRNLISNYFIITYYTILLILFKVFIWL